MQSRHTVIGAALIACGLFGAGCSPASQATSQASPAAPDASVQDRAATTSPSPAVSSTDASSTSVATPAQQAASIEAAKALFAHYRESDGEAIDTDPARIASRLRALIQADQDCSKGENLCEIGSDPWLAGGGQEGGLDADAPVTFKWMSGDATHAVVRIDYTYAWSQDSKEAQATLITLERANARAPWLLADLTTINDGKAAQSFADSLAKAYPHAKP